jgi:hypothetical protein
LGTGSHVAEEVCESPTFTVGSYSGTATVSGALDNGRTRESPSFSDGGQGGPAAVGHRSESAGTQRRQTTVYGSLFEGPMLGTGSRRNIGGTATVGH